MVATKEDLLMTESRLELKILAVKEDLLMTESRLEVKILATKEDFANMKAEVIKWMFIFWVGQVVATFGFILLFIKK